MKSYSGKDLCKLLERHGWVLKRITGSHHIYAKEGVKDIIPIPSHGNKDLKKGTLRTILKKAGLGDYL